MIIIIIPLSAPVALAGGRPPTSAEDCPVSCTRVYVYIYIYIYTHYYALVTVCIYIYMYTYIHMHTYHIQYIILHCVVVSISLCC